MAAAAKEAKEDESEAPDDDDMNEREGWDDW
jgi:hypothetical protein